MFKILFPETIVVGFQYIFFNFRFFSIAYWNRKKNTTSHLTVHHCNCELDFIHLLIAMHSPKTFPTQRQPDARQPARQRCVANAPATDPKNSHRHSHPAHIFAGSGCVYDCVLSVYIWCFVHSHPISQNACLPTEGRKSDPFPPNHRNFACILTDVQHTHNKYPHNILKVFPCSNSD